MAKWLAKEFDWTLGKYTGNYYNIAEAGIVSVFVDSYNGSDTNDGTALTPFKTLSKAITVLNSTGGNGSRIFMNGIFSENLPSQTYWYEFIGCGGGYNGRTIWYADYIINTWVRISKNLTKVNSVHLLGYSTNYSDSTKFFITLASVGDIRFVNMFVNGLCSWTAFHTGILYVYNSIWNNVYQRNDNSPHLINTTALNFTPILTSGLPATNLVVRGSNTHLTTSATTITNYMEGSVVNVDGQYIDPENGNFNLQPTSPLLFAGTPDQQTGIKSHVGAGIQGFRYNGLSNIFTTLGGAVLTNLEANEFGKLRRVNTLENGNVVSGILDLGNTYPITKIDVHNVFEYGVSGVTMGVFDNITTPRGVLTIKIKYGLILSDINTCPWLKIEYGKQPTYSGSNGLRVGNGDDTFDETDIKNINARFLQFNVSLKDVAI